MKTVDLEDSEFMFDRLPNSENGRFGRFGTFGSFATPNEPSSPKGGRLDKLCRDPRFHLQNSENEANLLVFLR